MYYIIIIIAQYWYRDRSLTNILSNKPHIGQKINNPQKYPSK